MGLSIVEKVEIDGEEWEIEHHVDLDPSFWIGCGAGRGNRGCVVSAHDRSALLERIPKARETHRWASGCRIMEDAIVTAFKDVLTNNALNGYRRADDYAERQEKFAKIRAACADLWPWIFDENKGGTE